MLWTVKRLSEILAIKEPTLYLWVKRKKIPHIRIHSLIRFDPKAIARWLRSFTHQIADLPPSLLTGHDRSDLDLIIARVKQHVYTAGHGETRPKSGLIGKEETDGAV